MPTATELLAAILDELDNLAAGERADEVRDRVETIGMRYGLLPPLVDRGRHRRPRGRRMTAALVVLAASVVVAMSTWRRRR